MKRWVPFAVVALAVTACQDASGPSRALKAYSSTAALVKSANPIPGSYIVVMRDAVANVDGEVDQIGQQYGTSATYRYRSAIKGFAGRLSPAAVTALRNDPRVAYIEEDQPVHLVATQSGATWGIDRIDQRDRPLSLTYTYEQTGAGVDAYIIDTGILRTHQEFGNPTRAIFGYDAVTTGGTAADGNGHGTHVAGTVGGTTYGVAKAVRLIAVRVLDNSGSGTTAGVVAGIDWVTGNHTSGPAVANMSLGGGTSTALDDAVRRSIADGVVYAIAAGNSSADASTASPARVAEAITVGATDSNDAFASFSNFGAGVDILAPGVSITSSWRTSNTATNTISGTSMATPHVAGVAALYLQANPTATPAAVQAALVANATPSKITGVPGATPNRLLFSIFTPPQPVATVSVTPATNTIEVGQTVQLTATTDPAGRAVTWSSSDPTVASVSASGLVTGQASSGTTVTITATSEGKTGNATVTVNPRTNVSAVSVSPSSSTIEVGQTVQLTAATTPSGRAVTWSSNNTLVATVDANGLVKGVATGAVTITATSEGVSGTASVTVNPATVTAITVSPTSATIAVGATRQLTATTTPAGRTVTWTSSAPGVATVSATGLVRGVTAGAATITATSGGKSATSRITVAAACSSGNCQN